jgi:hypothetical protein
VTDTKRRITEPAEGLIRRVYRHSPRRFRPIIDQLTGIARAPAAAFELRLADPEKPDKKVDEALSVNIESSLIAAGLGPTWGIDISQQYAARITVADCHANGLEAYHDPVPNNPHHGSIWDLVTIFSTDPDAYERAIDALARASTIVAESFLA